MTTFTPYEALFGGSILGLSALLFLLVNARTAGISGLISQLLNTTRSSARIDSLLFLTGMIVAPLLISPSGFTLPDHYSISWLWLVVAAFLVGVGTNIGSGCTSGHGICGMGRFTKRSIIATMIFMATAIVTLYLAKSFL